MLLRRTLFGTLMVAAALGCAAAHAQATYPLRPIKLVLPQSAGAGPDALARALGVEMGRLLGQPVVVENRPGANGSLAASYVVGQPADGYTLFLAGVSNMSWNPYLYKKLSYNPTTDFVGVGVVANSPFVTVASTKLGVKSLPELIQKAKAQPGALNFASGGMGNSTHLATELLMAKTGIRMQHVPFSGAGGSTPYTTLMAGETDLMTSVPSDLVPMAQSGRVVPLAVTGDKRLAPLPDVPTFKELGIDMAVPGWYAVVARAGTPPAIVQQLNAAIGRAMSGPRMQDVLASQMLEPMNGASSEVERLTKRDAEAWGPIIERLDIGR